MTQQEVFIIANEITSSWNATVFLPMRPETFNRSNQLGHLSGYNVKAFTIAPPRTEHVIEKRLKYAIKMASGEELINKLTDEMLEHAAKMEFEKAAELRDKIKELTE